MTEILTRKTAVDPVPIWDPRFRKAAMKMGGQPPEWMQVFPYPSYDATLDGEKATFVTDDESQASIVTAFEAKGNSLVIDYEHQTDEDVYAPAAGRIVELVAGKKKGLLARCEWTDAAADDISSGRYFYDSPSYWFSPDDMRIYELRHLALTNYPGSYNRAYITDHSAIDYGMKKAAAKAGTRRPTMKLVCAKGGESMSLANILESLRYTVGRPVTVTGKELRGDLQKIIDAIPDTDQMVLLQDGQQKEDAKDQTIAHLLGDEKPEPKPVDAAAVTAEALKPVLIALDLKEGDGKAAALAIMNLKSSSAPIARVRELEQQLQAAQTKTDEEKVELLITSNKNVLPHMKEEIRRIGKQSYDLAKTFVDSLPPVDLSSQSQGTEKKAPPAPKSAPPADETDEQRASRELHDNVLAFAKQKSIDVKAPGGYAKAVEQYRKESQANG